MNITGVKQKRFLSIEIFHLFKKILNLLVLSTLFTSWVGAAIISFSFLIYANKILWDMVIATSLVTYSIYSLNRVTDIEEDKKNLPDRVNFLARKKHVILFLSVASYIAAIIIGLHRNIKTVLIFLIPFLIGLVYSIKIKSFRVKDIFAIKNISVSLSWSLSSSLLPFLFFHSLKMMVFLFIFLFLKVFINTVVFDVRDIEGDRMAGARTIPVVIGRDSTKKLLLFMNSLLFIWPFASLKMKVFTIYLPVIVFSVIYGYWYIIAFCKKERNSYYFDYLVDGEFIILFLLALFIHLFY